MAMGVVWAIGSALGFGALSAPFAIIGVLASRPTAWRSPLVVAAATGLLVQFAMIGVVRHDVQSPWTGHYVYVGASFVLMLARRSSLQPSDLASACSCWPLP